MPLTWENIHFSSRWGSVLYNSRPLGRRAHACRHWSPHGVARAALSPQTDDVS